MACRVVRKAFSSTQPKKSVVGGIEDEKFVKIKKHLDVFIIELVRVMMPAAFVGALAAAALVYAVIF